MTTYIILKAKPLGEDEVFLIDGKQEATSGSAAIRAHVAQSEDPVDGSFVAVPARSWEPVPVKTEQRIRLG